MAARNYKVFDYDRIQAIEETPDHNMKVYLAALMYVESGFYVLPIVRGGKAIPPRKYEISYGNAARNKKTIEKWFHPDEGLFAGWNVGIATGRNDGVFVLDVDMHDDVNGFETLEEINEIIPEGPTQSTPNGGKHYLFAWQENALSSTKKVGVGIDTRGGTEDACKGHIVAWPSIVDRKQYTWDNAGPLPSIPKWIMDRMGVAWRARPQMGAGRGNENVEDPDVEEIVPIPQLERMLAHIDPNELSYDDWYKIGMAIKSQYPDEDGLEVWDEWSSHGNRYDQKECRSRWEGFNPAGAVRMATVFWFAQKGGYERKPTDKKSNPLAVITERYNNEFAVVVVGGKLRVLKELNKTREVMATRYNLLSRADFSTLRMNDLVWLPDAKKPTPASDIWLADDKRRTFDGGMGMYPEGEPEGVYNTFAGFASDPIVGDCSLFKQHILDIVCNRDSHTYEFVLDWCADLFQDPANPKGVAIVMRGGEGTGKGTFANTIGMMCAPHYVHLIDENHLTGNFNGHMAESLVVFADEITWGGNRRTAGKLKGLVTEKHLLLERKGIDAVVQRNMVHMLIASNSEWVIPAGIDSRRWLVLDVSGDKRSSREYFTALNKELDNGGREAFMAEMMERKVKADLTLAPVTEALMDQRAMSASQDDSVTRWWRRVLLSERLMCDDVKDDNNTGWPSAVHKSNLYDEYEHWCMDRRLPVVTDGPFYKKMLKFGFANHKATVNKQRVRVYKVPEYQRAVKLVHDVTGFRIESDHEEDDDE